MDSQPGSALSSNDENPRVKFLCSFSGSILPRPQDGKLRYVGGETRIVSVPRDISFDDLMIKMRELFEGAAVLKYQQPDEDLDALVSVVNDDDVTNMMEEYDKLGSSDGFTRLRIFLFSGVEQQDGSMHFGDGDEREHERRYVDALNSLNDSPEFRTHPLGSPVMGSFDDVRVAEHYFNQMNLEGSMHGQRNMELPMAQMNLRHLTIPRSNTQIPVTQRYNEMEAPWSPAYYSPRQPESVNQRPVVDYPTSPSSCRFRTPYGDFADKNSEDYVRPPVNPHSVYEQQTQYTDNVVLLPTVPVVNENSGFPGNILQGPSGVYEGHSVCNNCRITFNRPPQVFETSNVGNGYLHVPCSCADCPPSRGMYVMNSDPTIHPSYYNRDHSEREWILPHHLAEDSRMHAGRLAPDNYVMENGVSMPVGHANACEPPHVHSPYIHNEDPRYAISGVDYGSQVFQDQAVATGPQIYTHLPAMEDRGVRYGNPSYAYGAQDNLYQVPPHGHNIPPQAMWRNIHGQVQGGPHYETPIPPHVVNGSMNMGYTRGTVEGALRGTQNQWADSSQKPLVFNGPEQSHIQNVNLIPNTQNNHPHIVEPVHTTVPDPVPITAAAASMLNFKNDDETSKQLNMIENGVDEGNKEMNHDANGVSGAFGVIENNSDALEPSIPVTSNVLEPSSANGCVAEDSKATKDDKLEFLPELIASAKEAAVQNMNEVKAKVQEDTACAHEDCNPVAIEGAQDETNEADDHVELEVDVDNECVSDPKIEPTKAEAEAIDHGLQTIRNDDLEEIRELGSGTYGSVFHGKWRGSDVAIKRIKASCFAGKPSERERLIADFWKEAQILSSLHHPNVVAFYGVVRDGPDGSLATVTEFMINGSLKQFLQKKDRTIDRRKRLLIAMDTAFGMEYLHGKNIVHFDLKCENLLVNMRDPHRPVCKIGDLGLSKVKQHTLVSGGVRGTLPWMAPELLSGKSNMVTEKIDVYSFGIVMWELLTGDEPYADMHCASIIGGIVNNTLRPQIPTWCDPEWKALMESSWASDPAQRPSFSEISQKLRTMAAAMNLK